MLVEEIVGLPHFGGENNFFSGVCVFHGKSLGFERSIRKLETLAFRFRSGICLWIRSLGKILFVALPFHKIRTSSCQAEEIEASL